MIETGRIPAWAKKLVLLIEENNAVIKTHGTRLDALEGVYTDIEDIRRFTSKIWAAVKWGGPSIISALLAAGYVSGDIAAILLAVFG